MRLQQAILSYLEAAENRNCAPGTLKLYRGEMRRLQNHFGAEREIREIDRAKLKNYLAQYHNLKPITRATRTSILKAFFAHCVKEEYLESSSAAHLEPPRFRPADRQPYTEGEIQAILVACQTPQERGLVLLMLHSGLRVSDAILLRKKSLIDGFLQARKNGRVIPLELPPGVVAALQQAELFAEGEWVFGNGAAPSVGAWENRLARVYKRSGVAGAISHRFRHTISSRLAAQGISIRMISKILGITEAVAEKNYAKYMPEETENIRLALRTIGGTSTYNF